MNKKQIFVIRVLLTVFYGFLLSNTLFSYIIHGSVGTMRRPDPYLIAMIVIGALILIAIGLATYATWYKSQIILLISGFVLIAIFILTLVFGIVRIVRSADSRSKPPSTTIKEGEKRDHYVLAEDVAKLVIELLSILFGILASFLLYRCIRADEYAEVSTISPSA